MVLMDKRVYKLKREPRKKKNETVQWCYKHHAYNMVR